MNLEDMVIARTVEGEHEGRIVGRTLEGNAKYDVRTPTGFVFINVPAKYVQLAVPTAKPTPPAAPKVNVSQPRENGLCASPGHRASTPADTSMPQLS